MIKPLIAIIGRPNVGKSTFFNRITRSRNAIVDDHPGITRDRHYGDVIWNEKTFTLVDTGGYIENDEDVFAGKIREQVRLGVSDADAVILLLDGKNGVSPFDRDLIELLRTGSKPVFYVVNKIDGLEQEKNIFEFYNLGVESLFSISAEHGYGVSDFMDTLTESLPETPDAGAERFLNIAIVGKPNVGKSSLINRIVGRERLLVTEHPGTTRDSIEVVHEAGKKSYRIIDTAGIRRKRSVSDKIEKFSIIKALKSLERCDVALIIIDAAEGVTEQDVTIAGYAFERGCGCVLLLNKWDLIEKGSKTEKQYINRLKEQTQFLNFAPALTISALTGLRIRKIFKVIDEVYEQYSQRIGTGKLNRIMEQAFEENPPSLYKGKRLKFYYTTQVSEKPPTFVCFVNFPEGVHFSYKRFITNRIRQHAGLDKTPIRVWFRQRTGRIEFPKKNLKKQDKKKKTIRSKKK